MKTPKHMEALPTGTAMTETDAGTTERFHTVVPVASVLLLLFVVQGAFLAISQPAVRVILLVAASILSVVALSVGAIIARRDERVASSYAQRAFLVTFLGLGLLYWAFFPPTTVPDEDIHFSASYSYANLFSPSYGAHDVRQEDHEFTHDPVLYAHEVSAAFWVRQKEGIDVFATHTGVVEDEKFAHDIDFGTDAPQLKVFPALGISLARLLNLSGVVTFYVGRLFNLLSCCAVIVLAVRLMPVGRNILMCIALLPMTLHLLGSYSYDAMILALSFLLIALLMRAITGEGRMSRRLMVSSVVVAMLLAPCKIVYVSLTLLALAAPGTRFTSRRSELVWKCCMLVLPIMTIVIMRARKLLVMSGASETDNMAFRRSKTQTIYTFGEAVAHPIATLGMLVRGMYRHADFYYSSLLGGSLGWFQGNIAAQKVQEVGLVLALACSSLPSQGDERHLHARGRLFCAMLYVAGVLLVFFSMMLIWTVVGADVIQGVQGRYFIPLLPLLLLAMRGKTIVAQDDIEPALLAVLAGFNCMYLAQIAFSVLGGTI